MAVFDLEEQERIDALTDWWKQNSRFVYIGLAAFVIVVAGIKGWQYRNNTRAETVAERFAEFEKASAGKDAKQVRAAAEPLQKEFPESFYAARAAFAAAVASVEAKDLDGAAASLRWVVDHARSPALKNLARLRLAAVLLDQGKWDDALRLLDDVKDAAFAGQAADIKGDIFVAQGKAAEARASYKLALESAASGAPAHQLTQLKLDALGDPK